MPLVMTVQFPVEMVQGRQSPQGVRGQVPEDASNERYSEDLTVQLIPVLHFLSSSLVTLLSRSWNISKTVVLKSSSFWAT